MLRIRTGGAEGRERVRAVSIESALRTWMLAGGSLGQAEGGSGGRLRGWKKWPVGGACGAEERREGRRSLVSEATRERRVLFVVEGREGGGRCVGARRSG